MSGGRFRVKKRLQVRIRGGDGFNRDLRRVIYPNKVTKPSQCLQMPSASSEPLTDDAPVSSTESKKPQRTYKERRQSEAEMWDGLRSDMLKIRIEGSCPGSSECCLCSAACTNIVFCNDCGPAAYYCEQCCATVHQIVLYHNPCIWKGDMYIPYTIRTSLPLKRMDHDCDSVYSAPVTVFNKSGQQHEVMLEFCRCEKEPVSLLRYKLWPSSPVTPRVAFDIELLEMACALQLDAQLPLKSFCVALKKLKCPFPFLPNFQEKNLYRCLVKDAFAEYRFHRSKYFGDPFPSDADDEKNPCPVCEVADFPPILSMDGNFGLVHKKSAGEGSKMSRQKEKFFFNQEKVDSFVASYCKDKKNPNEECSNFHAGNILRSKKKTDKLDITGIFGSVCHHDIPQKFLNLRHGERLAYPVYLMENFQPSGGESVIMYDIACALHKHLKNVNNQSLLSKFKFVVPVFHSYAHNLKCQLSYGQRFVPGIGLADGEGTERLWSFLRRFSSITKEMSVPNRHDLLVEALLHYTENRISGLGESLERQLAHSRTVKCESQTEYEEIEKQQPGSTNASQWLETLHADVERRNATEAASRNSDTDYTRKLSELHSLPVERQYILTLLRKYSDGQKMAIRISRQLTALTKRIQKKLDEANTFLPSDSTLEFHDVISPSAKVYEKLALTIGLNNDQMKGAKLYALYCHAVEQEERVLSEIQSLLLWIEAENDTALEKLSVAQVTSRYDIGRKHMMLLWKYHLEHLWLKFVQALKHHNQREVRTPVHAYLSQLSEEGNILTADIVADLAVTNEDSAESDSSDSESDGELEDDLDMLDT